MTIFPSQECNLCIFCVAPDSQKKCYCLDGIYVTYIFLGKMIGGKWNRQWAQRQWKVEYPPYACKVCDGSNGISL